MRLEQKKAELGLIGSWAKRVGIGWVTKWLEGLGAEDGRRGGLTTSEDGERGSERERAKEDGRNDR